MFNQYCKFTFFQLCKLMCLQFYVFTVDTVLQKFTNAEIQINAVTVLYFSIKYGFSGKQIYIFTFFTTKTQRIKVSQRKTTHTINQRNVSSLD